MRLFTTSILLLISALISSNTDLKSQNKNFEQNKISILFDKLYYATNDAVKDSINSHILENVKRYIEDDANDMSLFKNIKNIYFVSSRDEKLMILTWTLTYANNTHSYFGYIKYYSKDRRKYDIDKIISKQGHLNDLDKAINIEEWYGAVYYELIEEKYKGQKYYVLLGWDGNNLFTNKKVIDIIEIEEGNYPVFGKNIFETDKGLKRRIIFEYGERVTMSLRYDKALKMIIWDHLSPSKPELEGHYEYYGPDLTFDGYVFTKGIFKLIKDIQIIN